MVTQNPKQIILVKQSYEEARNSQTFGDLELLGLVTGSSEKIPFGRAAIDEVNNELRLNAQKLEADYVFGIEYRSMAGSHQGGTIGYGDAYKIKK